MKKRNCNGCKSRINLINNTCELGIKVRKKSGRGKRVFIPMAECLKPDTYPKLDAALKEMGK